MKHLVLIGNGETAKLAYEYFTYDSKYEVIAFAVDDEYLVSNTDRLFGLPVIALSHLSQKYSSTDVELFVAISSTKLNRARRELYCRYKKLGYHFATYISTQCFVWRNVVIGENCFILENNTLQPFVSIGNNVFLWSGNHVGHRTSIHDNCFISSHCVISGFCTIGENSFLGVNCTLEDNIDIAKDSFIGASALIRKNTDFSSVFQLDATQCSKISSHRLFRIKE